MVYKFLLLSDEEEDFSCEMEIDADETFYALHKAIAKTMGYEADQMASFFLCNDSWEKEREITLMDMGADFDALTMEEAVLSDYLDEKGQKMLYVFDLFSDRAFYIKLKNIKVNETLDEAQCLGMTGVPPQQIRMEDEPQAVGKNAGVGVNDDLADEDFYGDEAFNEDEFDEEGYSDMSLEDF